ncbi:oxidoreductase [Tessaracoccus sp. OS52]|uniref:NAD-dependent epimerase/dehydratase family protein n=1 Tax=Tessaracoccus sp. OS52 TaxID=2886691 RepID=UPI001D0FCA50|nr:NAD-dependent epimerase/dehydratase family protein [Tessaracoccus sp. OS52]MCC2593912.1 oxidoreductase [Tessaracoccus sp. OS52]
MRRVLVLGGTAWLGGEIARQALAADTEVVCLARGRSGSTPDGVRFVRADRTEPHAYSQLDGDWDDVVELSFERTMVESALDALAHRARHWTLVSTMSVYLRNDEPGADESAELLQPDDPEDYGKAKVAAERLSVSRLGDRLLSARAGLIVGPGDPSDRFGYWPGRLHRGGRVLAPPIEGRCVQVIDVADLAGWIVDAGRRGMSGVFNAVGDSQDFSEFLALTRAVTGFDGDLVTADDDWLVAHDVNCWAGPRSLPLWLPPSFRGFSQRSNAAFRASGATLRPMRETLERVLADEVARGVERPRRSGLSPEEEAELLASL